MYSNSSSIILQRAGIILTWQHVSYTIDFSREHNLVLTPQSQIESHNIQGRLFKEQTVHLLSR